jgi:Flp pilus assembly protein TadG
MLRGKNRRWIGTEKGSILLMVGAAMVMMLGVSAIAIDLVNLYLARTQAQRAADAAALAGAEAFISTGCTTGGCNPGGIQETVAKQQAVAVAAQNDIAGQPAVVDPASDVIFSYPTAQEPQITVSTGRSVETFFAKVFGIQTVNISAKATAEAYNQAGDSNTKLGATCVKPFLLPNCDPNHPGEVNPNCATSGQYYFFDPNSQNQLLNPGVYPSGVQGMPWSLHSNSGPSQWYLAGFADASTSSSAALRDHIAECTPAIYSCGDYLPTANGTNLGGVRQGVNTLIHSDADGLNHGQDSIDTTTGPPFAITGGYNNPNPALRGKVFYDYSESPSVVTVPVYNGSSLPPGGMTVQVQGYMQVFIQDIHLAGTDKTIDSVILNVSYCGGQSGSTNTTVAQAGSPIPIRLIRTN